MTGHPKIEFAKKRQLLLPVQAIAPDVLCGSPRSARSSSSPLCLYQFFLTERVSVLLIDTDFVAFWNRMNSAL